MMRLRSNGLTGRHVLAITIGFFAVVSAVNAAMVWLAIDSFPGLSSRNAYREGLDWNRTLDARRRQEELGWQVTVDVTGDGARRAVAARFLDRDGRPLSGLAVTARLVRPVVAGSDRMALLVETAPGAYAAPVELDAAGNWRLNVDAVRGGETIWRMERTLWLK